MRIDKGYAVQKQGNLVVRTAVDADVRLNTKPSALSDISCRRAFENVVDAGDTRRFEVGSCQGRDLPCRHLCRQRGACGRHLRFAQVQRVACCCGFGLFGHGATGQCVRGLEAGSRTGQCGRAQHADAYLSVQTAEQSPAFAAEVAEGQHTFL